MPAQPCDTLFSNLNDAIDGAFPDSPARETIKSQLASIQDRPEFQSLRAMPVSDERRSGPDDRWVSRARPMFLYVMYAIILWALPIGLIAAVDAGTAQAMARAMSAYLCSLPDALYTLFGTGYLGYATLRQWGKVKGAGR